MQGNLFGNDPPPAAPAAPATAVTTWRHKTCGNVSVIERPRTGYPGQTELWCEVCRWVIHELHVAKVVER